MIKIVKIPKERLGVLIGKKGQIKKQLEKKTSTKITVEEEGIEITGEYESVVKTEQVIKAIGRGFSPEKAFLLLNENYILYIVTLRGKTSKHIKRLLGRVIGREGKVRKRIEESTGCYISVFGKTVSIIGEYENIKKAVHAVEFLLEGKSHSYVFKFLKNYIPY